MKSNKRKKLKKELDKLTIEYIRLRDKMTCQVCRKRVEGVYAQTSHIIPKSNGIRLRYDPENLMLKCFNCHRKWHDYPAEAIKWFKANYPDRWKYLKNEQSKGIKRFSLPELEDLRDWLKNEITQRKDRNGVECKRH